jgi:hypothetical protein
MRSDIEYLTIGAREGIAGNGHTLPPTEFRTITDQGVANFNRKIAAYAHLWCFGGTETSWILGAMQGPSLRLRPDFISKNGGIMARWRRDDEP